jgi:DNA polymerase sigma
MCDIGDASRGSLSSYAYTLLALFFLQQRNPPVIPVLQEVDSLIDSFRCSTDTAFIEGLMSCLKVWV